MIDPLFISHGAPDLLVTDNAAHRALQGLAPPPGLQAILVVSAHWLAEPVRVQSAARPATVHDFRGFGPELDRARYDAPGAPELAARVIAQLQAAGLAARGDAGRGRDHGAWVPLALMHPDADIPVFQVSLPDSDRAALALGHALAPLAAQQVQIIGSGSLTHSLEASLTAAEAAPVRAEAAAFASWLTPRLQRGDPQAVLDWPTAPHAAFNHPTPEHLRPVLVAMAASGGGRGTRVHQSWSRSALAMDIWQFAA